MEIPSFRKNIAACAALALGAGTAASLASSHREAPYITQSPQVDATDFYMFRSYEAGRDAYVTLVANYNPLQDAYGGPNYFALDPDALYEIHIDNSGDGQEDITFQFRVSQQLGNNGDGIKLSLSGKDVAVPLKNIGEVSSVDSSALNYFQSFSLTMVNGDRRTGTAQPVTNVSAGGSTSFAIPYDNVGGKTFNSQSYADYAQSFIADINLPGCPAGAQDGRVFVGQRKESFAVNLGEVFDLVNLNPLGAVDGEQNVLANKNVTSFALEVPIACLSDSAAVSVIGGWTSASKPQVQVLDPTPDFDRPAVQGGAWTQISRLGMPLVNEVVIGLPDKNRFNASEPKDDAQFLTYVTNPTLPALLEVLFGVRAPTVPERPDLVAAFLTGIDGVNADGGVAEMQRLNVTIAPTAAASQSNLGVLGGDNAGFPNGRRPGDDVVDAELRVAMGVLCHAGLGLCQPGDAPDGTLAYTDGALQNAAQFDNAFPYLTTPVAGSPSN